MYKFIQTSLIIFTLALALSGCVPQAYNNTYSERETITIVDEEDRLIEVPYRPASLACLVPAVAEVTCALGDEDKIVACSYECNFPPSLRDKTNVGSASKPNIELLLKQQPEIIIARTGTLFKQELRDKLENAGIPVIQFRSIELDTAIEMTRQMGLVLDKEAKAAELIDFIEHYQNLVADRTNNLADADKPLVLFQSMGHMYWSNNANTAGHRRIVAAGGNNIAADEPVTVPHLSAEWVLKKNPEITIYSYLDASDSGKIPTLEELKTVHDNMVSQPGFKEIAAVTTDNVYIIDSRLLTGPRSIIGLLYYAKWSHPSLFEDIDPMAVHREMLQKFWNLELEGDWVYPVLQ